ncbi:MAG: hypothetical protein M3N13_09755 [Candidatus Eremiobacteraeota bacterium]|nr:hypothetical protein [Candidatus Eremiobacteraeota bacterium]
MFLTSSLSRGLLLGVALTSLAACSGGSSLAPAVNDVSKPASVSHKLDIKALFAPGAVNAASSSVVTAFREKFAAPATSTSKFVLLENNVFTQGTTVSYTSSGATCLPVGAAYDKTLPDPQIGFYDPATGDLKLNVAGTGTITQAPANGGLIGSAPPGSLQACYKDTDIVPALTLNAGTKYAIVEYQAIATGYDSIPNPVQGVPSYGFAANGISELGDGLNLTRAGALESVSVVLVSFGCTTGHYYDNTCATTAGATFDEPITLNVYNLDSSKPSSVGTAITSVTNTYSLPYRPSASAQCTGKDAGKYFNASDNRCENGLPYVAKFAIPAGTNVPQRAIFTFAYNTSTSGAIPYGTNTACYTSSGGCGYDSLNVGAQGNGGPIGSVYDVNGIFVNYASASNYCDGGSGGSGFLRLDTGSGCNAGFHPQIRVRLR